MIRTETVSLSACIAKILVTNQTLSPFCTQVFSVWIHFATVCLMYDQSHLIGSGISPGLSAVVPALSYSKLFNKLIADN